MTKLEELAEAYAKTRWEIEYHKIIKNTGDYYGYIAGVKYVLNLLKTKNDELLKQLTQEIK